jgi:hypothetical protein
MLLAWIIVVLYHQVTVIQALSLKKKPTEYLKQLYFDTLVFTPEALRHLANQVGTSQLIIGTDQPIPWNLDPYWAHYGDSTYE